MSKAKVLSRPVLDCTSFRLSCPAGRPYYPVCSSHHNSISTSSWNAAAAASSSLLRRPSSRSPAPFVEAMGDNVGFTSHYNPKDFWTLSFAVHRGMHRTVVNAILLMIPSVIPAILLERYADNDHWHDYQFGAITLPFVTLVGLMTAFRGAGARLSNHALAKRFSPAQSHWRVPAASPRQ